MPSPELTERAEAARQAAIGQADLLHRDFGKAVATLKPDGSRITATDIAISEAIQAEILQHFPEDQFFSEELANAPAPIPLRSRFSWILDPIDGTSNFAAGIPNCAISLGLLDNGEPVYGAIYDMSRRVLMHGGPGFGAWDGEREAKVRLKTDPGQVHIAIHSPSDKSLVPFADAIMREYKIRALGSATLHLAYVAAGMLDGAVDFNVKIWDIAAAIPLCRAAGGEVHFLDRPLLPLRAFDLNMKRIVYVAGGPAVAKRLKELSSPFRLRIP